MKRPSTSSTSSSKQEGTRSVTQTPRTRKNHRNLHQLLQNFEQRTRHQSHLRGRPWKRIKRESFRSNQEK